MFKIIATLAAAFLLSAVTLATAAEAGCGGGHRSYVSKKSAPSASRTAQLRARKAAEARAVAAAKRKQPSAVAKAEAPAPAPAPEVRSETTEAPKDAVAVAAAPESKCMKFVAATGTTVEVECSKE